MSKHQYAMVMDLNKCLGCQTCTIACKKLWTDRDGTGYMYWNNVETRPGLGYPRHGIVSVAAGKTDRSSPAPYLRWTTTVTPGNTTTSSVSMKARSNRSCPRPSLSPAVTGTK